MIHLLRRAERRRQAELVENERRRRIYAPMVRQQTERNRDDVRSTGDYVHVKRDTP